MPQDARNDGGKTPISRLLEVMAQLRDPESGCPWDLEQDHRTLKAYLIEEVHEVLEAIDNEDWPHLQEELGDVLIQVVFHSQLAREAGRFDFHDVAQGIADKLTRRHPHIFAPNLSQEGSSSRPARARPEAPSDALQSWEEIKKAEKKKTSIFEGIPHSLPSLLKAYRVQEKASIVGFDFENVDQIVAKIREEVEEFESARAEGSDAGRLEEEFGDLIFSLVNLSRLMGLNAEFCLEKSTRKFIQRFKRIESRAAATGRRMEKMSLEEMDTLWEEAKSHATQSE